MADLHSETAKKIKNGYAKVVWYEDIKGNTTEKLKISPVATIPHKLWEFRAILDLSIRLKHNIHIIDSVLLATTKKTMAESMIQLGPCVKKIIATLADN